MNGHVIPFEYKANEVRAIRDENGEPWFVAKDVCDILGYVNSRDVIRTLDEDERNTVDISDGIEGQNGQPGNPNVNVISESGLYTLIIRSNKEAAKPFRRWVTHEVLPALRKTGTYTVPGSEADAEKYAEIIAEAISRLNDGLVSVTASVRALNAAYGRPLYDAESMGNKGATTTFGIRPVSRSLMMRDETVRDFIETCCLIHPDASCKPMELHEAYQAWCQGGAATPLGRNTFYKSFRTIATRTIFAARSVAEENGSVTCVRVAHGVCLNRDGRYYAVAWEGGAS